MRINIWGYGMSGRNNFRSLIISWKNNITESMRLMGWFILHLLTTAGEISGLLILLPNKQLKNIENMEKGSLKRVPWEQHKVIIKRQSPVLNFMNLILIPIWLSAFQVFRMSIVTREDIIIQRH